MQCLCASLQAGRHFISTQYDSGDVEQLMQQVRKGRFTSSWLQQHIRDHGGVMSVSVRTVIVG